MIRVRSTSPLWWASVVIGLICLLVFSGQNLHAQTIDCNVLNIRDSDGTGAMITLRVLAGRPMMQFIDGSGRPYITLQVAPACSGTTPGCKVMQPLITLTNQDESINLAVDGNGPCMVLLGAKGKSVEYGINGFKQLALPGALIDSVFEIARM